MPLLFALAAVLAVVALVPLSLLLRYRAGTARRRARGWMAAINAVAIACSASLFLAAAAVTSFWVPHAFSYALLGLLAGGLLGVLGLWLSRWEATPKALHYTPNRWVVLGLMLVVTARLGYGLWRGWRAGRAALGSGTTLASFGVAGSLAAGALVLGSYLAYWIGIWRRARRHRRSTRRPPVILSTSRGDGAKDLPRSPENLRAPRTNKGPSG
ncbi:MAG TPA: DUF1453 domain-containing protein [Vicinamibacteria bacterium]